MVLNVVQGNVGSGKSLFCAWVSALYGCMGRQVYSNLHLHFPYTKLDFSDLIDLESGEISAEIQDAVMIVDEAYLWIESRASSSKKNRLLSYLLLQSRKRNLDIFLVAHSMHQLDRRVRENCDVLYTCRFSGSRQGPESGVEGDVVEVKRVDFTGGSGESVFMLNAAGVWPLFDSSQIFPVGLE